MQKALPIDVVEDRVADLYRPISLTTELRAQVEAEFDELVSGAMEEAPMVEATLRKQHALLKDRQRKLMEAHYAGAIPIELLRAEQQQLSAQLGTVEDRLSVTDVRFEAIRSNLERALDLSEDCAAAYRDAPDHVRRWFNQAFFTRILVGEDETQPS